MTMLRTVKPAQVFMGRLEHGADLLAELNSLVDECGVTLGRIEAIGAVMQARVGCYDQTRHTYGYVEFDREMEITKLTGNVSLKDGQPMVHAHITLADEQGQAFGGHLAEGTRIFACEVIIEAYAGDIFARTWDETTGLSLWEKIST